MKRTAIIFLGVLLTSIVFIAKPASALFKKGSVEDQRKAIIKRSGEILSALYKAHPKSKMAIEKAYGYATFSNFGIQLFVAGGGNGRGLAVVNGTENKTYMKMIEIQAGFGLGIKEFMLICVFENKKAFDRFVKSEFTLGVQGTAAVKNGNEGGSFQGAVQADEGMWLYQLTDKGLALELTVKGTKFIYDKKLNKAEKDENNQDVKSSDSK